VDAVRTAFAGDFATSPMVWGSVWAAVLFVAAVAWGTATFRKENA
jgi:ABC-2 type transport system permease protein